MSHRLHAVLTAVLLLAPIPAFAQLTPGAEPSDVVTPGTALVELGSGLSLDDGGRSLTGMQPLIRVGLVPGLEVFGGSGGWTAPCVVTCVWSPTTPFAGWRVRVPSLPAGWQGAVTGVVLEASRSTLDIPRRLDASVMLHFDHAVGKQLALTINHEIARLHDDGAAALRFGHGAGVTWDRGGRFMPLVRIGRRALLSDGRAPWFLEAGSGIRTGLGMELELAMTRGLTDTEPGWGLAATVGYTVQRPRS